ncbi:MAG: adenylate/guanylate cyclase domain-containing protein [Actinomycetota bacterium]
MLCSSCGATVPSGARFCPTCGQQQQTTRSTNEERRIVTVLFADLVGFTGLAEHMDPEQVKRLIDSCFEQLVGVVAEFGGRVDKILGDGMLVLFGAPVAHEDDPERAVRAALRMQERLTAHVATSGLAGSDGVRMRVGINTGEVLVGTLAGTDYTAMGDVVNTASRLQAAAPVGGVLVGETTHALTSHTFHYEAVGELQPRGREQSLTSWLAVEATAPPGSRRRRRRDIDIVGRHTELAIAQAALEMVTVQRRGMLLHVNGESGVGKSRLVDEVIARMRHAGEVTVLEGACVPYGESNAWWPIASALSSYFNQAETSDSVESMRDAALLRAGAIFPKNTADENERIIEVFTHLMGHPSTIDRLDATNARSTIHTVVGQVLEMRATKGPMVLSIDDLHWADPVLLDLLDSIVNRLARFPFVIITAMRPGTEVAWPRSTDRSTVISLTLQPLSRDESESLSRTLLSDNHPSDQMLSVLYDRSGGNPLFLIELAALKEAGGGGEELPDSLRTLISARLDQLTVEQRRLLENAAVLGTSGTVMSLEKFAIRLDQPPPAIALAELDELGLLEVRGHRWEFRSESVRDAAYQTLTKAARAQRHAGVAMVMRNSPTAVDDLAHHTASAAELVQELGHVDGVDPHIAEQAVTLLSAAADRALDSGSLRAAVRNATRALDLIEPAMAMSADVTELRTIRASASIDLRDFDSAVADIDALAELATERADFTLEAEAHRLRGMLANVAGRMDEARHELGVAVDLLRQVDRPDLLANSLRQRGFIEMFTGSLTDAEWFFGEADGLFRDAGDERGMAWVEQHRAWISFLSGDMELARERLTHAAETLGQLGDRNGVGWAFGLLAFIEFFERHFDEAEQLAQVVTKEAEERGDEWAAGMMDTLRADLRLWQGRLDEASTFAEKARSRFKKLNDRFGLIQSLAPLVRSQVALGRGAAAQRTSEELVALAESGRHGPFPLMAVAGAAMHRGNSHVAASMAERAIAEVHANGGSAFEPVVVLAMALAQQGRHEEALATIETVGIDGRYHPFTSSVSALVHVVNCLPAQALEQVAVVFDGLGASYLDQIFADVAAAGAHAQQGQLDLAELDAHAAVARALAVGDVVATAIATSAFAAVTGRTHPAFDDRTPIGDGWLHIIDHLTGQRSPE